MTLDLTQIRARYEAAMAHDGCDMSCYGFRGPTVAAALADIPALLAVAEACLGWHDALTRWEQTGDGYEDSLLAEGAARVALARAADREAS